MTGRIASTGDRAATPAGQSPQAVSGVAGIPCADVERQIVEWIYRERDTPPPAAYTGAERLIFTLVGRAIERGEHRSVPANTVSDDERWLRCSVEFIHMQDVHGIHEMGYEATFLHPDYIKYLDPTAARDAILKWQQEDAQVWRKLASAIEAATADETGTGSAEGESAVGSEADETPKTSQSINPEPPQQ